MIRMSEEGFTLIELMVVLAILALLAVLFLRNFSRLNQENSIEDDCRNIHAFLQQMRMKAFSAKQTLNIALRDNGKRLCETANSRCISLKNPFDSTGNFTITTRGTLSSGNIHVRNLRGSPAYSCVAISSTRIRLGEWNGNCNAK